MKFIDESNILVIAGRGGNGCVSFRREKFIRKGGPDGGDGGNGGNIYLIANRNINTLIDCELKKTFKAKNGKHGKNKNRKGQKGKDTVIKIPIGTKVYDLSTKKMIYDITIEGKIYLIAKGGACGLGNTRFKTSVNRSPKNMTLGKKGESKNLYLELNLLADVGIVGMPNTGKSTFINLVSGTKQKIADYPFTTIVPKLGMVKINKKHKFIIADIPGLIQGASNGIGLGIRFLKHLERCSILLHFIDIMPTDNSDPKQNIKIINEEIEKYSKTLKNKKKLLIFNKLDLFDKKKIKSYIENIIKSLNLNEKYYIISSLKGIGVSKLCSEISNILLKK